VRIHRAYRFRVYPTEAQVARLDAWQDALRFLWNLALEQRLWGLARPRSERRYYSAPEQQRQLTALRAELPWLADVPRHATAKVLADLDLAWQRCFTRLARQPRCKRKGRDRVSLCEPDVAAWSHNTDTITFPKLGRLRARVHRDVVGTPKSLALIREVDQWFAVITVEQDVADPVPKREPVVGLDRGVANLVADSDGRLVANPRPLQQSLARLAHSQRAVARKRKGSRNQQKARVRVAKLHRKVRRQRDYMLHVLSAGYSKSHGTVVVENLNVKNMTSSAAGSLEEPGANVRAKAGLNRAILDSGWSRFAFLLEYKLERAGGRLVQVRAAYSSQTCSDCGAVDGANRQTQTNFRCIRCGHAEHADLNAAKVIKSRSTVKATVEGCGGESTGTPAKQQLRAARRARQNARTGVLA